MARAHCLLDTLDYKHAHCFSTTKVVSRTRLNDTLYVHCLFYKLSFLALSDVGEIKFGWSQMAPSPPPPPPLIRN